METACRDGADDAFFETLMYSWPFENPLRCLASRSSGQLVELDSKLAFRCPTEDPAASQITLLYIIAQLWLFRTFDAGTDCFMWHIGVRGADSDLRGHTSGA
jgi:hypothetical protein